MRVLRDLRQQWLADNPSGRATRDEFATAAKTINVDSYVIDGIDAIFALSTFLQGNNRDRLKILFTVLDRDNNGLVQKHELRKALATHRRVVGANVSLNRVVSEVFLEADADHDGALSFEEFQQMVSQQPQLQQHFAVVDAVQRFNEFKTGWSGRYEAVRVLASELDEGTQENSGKLKDVPGPVVAEALYRSTGMTPDDALRQASERLCFPREAQQVDRLVTAFAWAYSQSNPESCMDEDAVSIVSYAILMLNSDAHNHTVRSKMTRSQFVSNTQQAAPGVQEELLEGIYERVQKKEIRLGHAGGILLLPGKDNVASTEASANNVNAVLGQLVSAELGTVLRGLTCQPQARL